VKNKVTTINLTPTWMGIYPTLKAMVMNGTLEQRKYVCEELEKLCRAADAVNEKGAAAAVEDNDNAQPKGDDSDNS